VQPRAARSSVCGLRGDRIVIRLAAPPVDGRANTALLELLAAEFGVPRSGVSLLAGGRGRDKRVRIDAPRRLPQWYGTREQ
jgi:uncharacterized protein (TIGR00251 family)